MKLASVDIKNEFTAFIRDLQNKITAALQSLDPAVKYREDPWQRPGGGGGITRILQDGEIFEKAGVNTSAVEGAVTPIMKNQLKIEGEYFFATGLSLVIHPRNPFVPTVHANFRYFELYDGKHNKVDSWFGGGADLTPYYLFEDDARHFHRSFREACDPFGMDLYPLFKQQCDAYFINTHREGEARGIGGIFFDYLRSRENDPAFYFEFTSSCARAFLPAYLPIVEKRKDHPYHDKHLFWQEIRRGRYVEFNLLHDRGTLFGLKTNGRTESILMSLPPRVRFSYDYQPEPGSEEEKLLKICRQPIDWIK